jgi:uncharacterized membrane protein
MGPVPASPPGVKRTCDFGRTLTEADRCLSTSVEKIGALLEWDQNMKHVTVAGVEFPPGAGPKPLARTSVRTIHQMLVPFSVAYFTAALVTDLAYWRTAEVTWERFSVWLITGGLIMAALAVLAAVIDLVSGRHSLAWSRAFTYALVIVLSLFNVFVHSRDGYTAVVPAGLTLSAFVVIIQLLFMSSGSWAFTLRHCGARS